MRTRKIRKIWKILLILLLLFIVTPYLVPLPKAAVPAGKPFDNSRFEIFDGFSLHYRVWTPKKIRGKILLVHGLAGSTFSFRYNFGPLVNAGYLVVAADLPGFGYSDRRRGFNHAQENRAKLLWQLLDRMDAQYPNPLKWTLVGHSMGAGAVTAMALADKERPDLLVYVDGAVLPNGRERANLLGLPPLSRWFEVVGRYGLLSEKQIRGFLESAYGRPVSGEELSGYLEPLKLPGTESAFVDMINTTTQLEADRLRDTDIPAFGIWGAGDTWVPVDQAYKLKGLIPGFELKIIQNAGHCPMETHPEEFNQILLDRLLSPKE